MDALGAFRIPTFRNYLLAKLLFVLGAQVQIAAVRWQVYSLTKDPLALAWIGLIEAIAFIAVALFGGHLADMIRPGKIILACLSILAGCSGCLLLLAGPGSFLLTNVTPIYAVIAVSGAARGILSPALFAFMTALIPPRLYASSATWSSGSWQMAAVAGPAIGGLLYGAAGPIVAYTADITLVLGAIVFATISIRTAPEQTLHPVTEGLSERLTGGIRFVFANQLLLGAMSLDLFAVLFGGAAAMIPLFADRLGTGAQGMGFLMSAPAAGAVAMSVVLAFAPLGRRAGWVLLTATAGFGLCMIGFALSSTFLFSMVFLVCSGAMDQVSVVVRSTIMQRFTPEHMRGRVSAVNSIFVGSSNEIGAFESGLMAKILGLVPSVLFGASMTLVTVSATTAMAKKLRELDLSSPQEQ